MIACAAALARGQCRLHFGDVLLQLLDHTRSCVCQNSDHHSWRKPTYNHIKCLLLWASVAWLFEKLLEIPLKVWQLGVCRHALRQRVATSGHELTCWTNVISCQGRNHRCNDLLDMRVSYQHRLRRLVQLSSGKQPAIEDHRLH